MQLKRIAFILLSVFAALTVDALDRIVLRNGDIIDALVQKIGSVEIEYKKASNPNGPTYTVAKTDVLAINYENGDKDTFESESVASNQGPTYLEPTAAADNQALIENYNIAVPRHKSKTPDEKKFKSTKGFMYVYGITPESILSDSVVTISFEVNDTYINPGNDILYDKHYGYRPNYKVFVHNKSDKTIYVDVVNSFRIKPNGEAESFYNRAAISHNSSSSSGAGIGLGAVTSALGIGGVIGNIASGIGLGSETGNATSVTETDPTVLTIPPGAKVIMPKKTYFAADNTPYKNYEVFYFRDIITKDGPTIEKWRYNDFGDLMKDKSQKYIITYSVDKDFATYTSLPINVYVRGVLGIGGIETVTLDNIVMDDGIFFMSSHLRL